MMESGPMLTENPGVGTYGLTRNDWSPKDYSKLPIKKRKLRSAAVGQTANKALANLPVETSTATSPGQSRPTNNRAASATPGRKSQRASSRANSSTSKKLASPVKVKSPTTPQLIPSTLDQGSDDALACLVAVASACADQAQVVADSVAVQQVRDSCIDSNGEGPSVKEILNASSFLLLPVEYQQRLLTLLPEVDRVQQEDCCRPSDVAFSNAFFTKACEQWKEQLKNGTLWHGADVAENTEVPQRCLRATKSRCTSRLHQQLNSLPPAVQEIVQELPTSPTSAAKKSSSRRTLQFGDNNRKSASTSEDSVGKTSPVKESSTSKEGDIHPFDLLLQALDAVSPPTGTSGVKRRRSQSYSHKNGDADAMPPRKRRRSFSAAGKKSMSAKTVVAKSVMKTTGSNESGITAMSELAKPPATAEQSGKRSADEQHKHVTTEVSKTPVKDAGRGAVAKDAAKPCASSTLSDSAKTPTTIVSAKVQTKETAKSNQLKEGGKPLSPKQSSGKPTAGHARSKGSAAAKKMKSSASSKCMLSRVPFHARVGHLRSRFSTMPPFTMYDMPEEDIGDMCQVMSSGFDHDYSRSVSGCNFTLVPAISRSWRLDHNYSKPPSALSGTASLGPSPSRLCPASARLTSVVPSAGISWLSPPRLLPSDLGMSQPTYEPMDPADLASVPEVGMGAVQPQAQPSIQTKTESLSMPTQEEDSTPSPANVSNSQVTLLSLPAGALGQLMAVAQSSLRSSSAKPPPSHQQEGAIQKAWPLIIQPVTSSAEKLSVGSNGFITQSLLLLDPAAGQQVPSNPSKSSMPQAVSVNLV